MTLVLEGVELRRGPFVLGPVDLEVPPGITVLAGPSGSGKTTLLDVVSGLLRPDAGSVRLRDLDFTGLPPHRRGMGYVFQQPALFPHLRVRGNLEFGLGRGAEREAETRAVVRQLRIGDLLDRWPHQLSGGEAQRVALGRTLITRPRALLLDEPLSHLDAPLRRQLRSSWKGVLKELGAPILWVTHDLDDALALADRVAVVEDGNISQVGSLKEVLSNPGSPFVAEFTGTHNLLAAEVHEVSGGLWLAEQGPFQFRGVGEPSLGSRIQFGIVPDAITLSLEKVRSSARNRVKGTVALLIERGPLVEVSLEVEDQIPLRVMVTPGAVKELGLEEGQSVIATWKAASIRLL